MESNVQYHLLIQERTLLHILTRVREPRDRAKFEDLLHLVRRQQAEAREDA